MDQGVGYITFVPPVSPTAFAALWMLALQDSMKDWQKIQAYVRQRTE
jgi:hypothetical protein